MRSAHLAEQGHGECGNIARQNQRGKKTLLSLTLVRLDGELGFDSGEGA